jgi:hypothetical protein
VSIDKLIEKQLQKMDSLLQKRSDLYDQLQPKLKEELIQMYKDSGGKEKLTLKHTKHEILCEMMELVYSLDPIIRQNQILMNQKRLLEGGDKE